jgi:hypothetical protein
MSFVTTQPEALSSAATALGGIGSSFSAQNAAAAAPTTGVVPAAADEVSALTAAQFAAHAQLYQAVAAQAAAIHEQFVNTLGTSAGSYAATEAANAAAAGYQPTSLSAGHRDGARPTAVCAVPDRGWEGVRRRFRHDVSAGFKHCRAF